MWSATTPSAVSHGQTLASILFGAATVAAAYYNSTLLEEASTDAKVDPKSTDKIHNPIETNLMDKIASKVYLNPARVRKNRFPKRNGEIPPFGVPDALTDRPLGVPARLRVLAIDLPELRDQAFSHGDCRVAFDRVYPDGIAPPTKVERYSDDKGASKTQLLEVEQKAWVKSMVKCMQKDLPDKVGVEVMEASFTNLNPKNLRKTRRLGGYHYDPGKYTDSKQQGRGPSKEEPQVQEEDEHIAPWNQYAWIEELKLRVHGLIPFGDTLEPATGWSRLYNGHCFKATVSSQSKWFFPSFLQANPEGIDGTDNSQVANHNWASHKPHAVIANGAAVQRMPAGLRILQTICRDANVPLFVVNDPRAWGGNTHQNLHQALRDVRYVVKQNIILSAMEHQSGFLRGRRVGRMERTVEQWIHQAKQDRQRRQEAITKRQWQKLDAVALEKRLIEYGVLRKEDRVEDGKTYRQYTPAMVEIARRCVEDVQAQEQEEEALRGKIDGPNSTREGDRVEQATGEAHF